MMIEENERHELEFNTVLLMLHLHQKTREATDKNKASLHDIANVIGDISVSTLSRIDRGHAPDMQTFIKLCEVFSLTAGDYFKWVIWVRKSV
jgi:hypothetical protein